MNLLTEVLGNIHRDAPWQQCLSECTIDYLDLDPWEAQKSRLHKRSAQGRECAIALPRGCPLSDGDVLAYDAAAGTALVVRIARNRAMVIDLSAWAHLTPPHLLQHVFQLGHALGNQHWPACVRGWQVWVPVVADEVVMRSVMNTHHFEGVKFTFQAVDCTLPFVAPCEVHDSSKPHAHGGTVCTAADV